MSGAAKSPGSKRGAASATAPDWGHLQGDVAALIRMVCAQGVRRGVRVVATDKRGHIFFDQGHVVHAEFGEDVGLGAVIEMLSSRPVEFRPCARPWPSQPTLFFTAEKLLAAARPGASNLITGVRLKPGVLTEDAAREAHERSLRPLPPAPPSASAARDGAAPPSRPGLPPAQPLAAAVTELSRAVAAAVQRPSLLAGVSPAGNASAPSSAGAQGSASSSAAAQSAISPSSAGGSSSAPASSPRPGTRTMRGPFVAPPPESAVRPSASARSATPAEPRPAPASRPGSAAREAAAEQAPLTPARTLALSAPDVSAVKKEAAAPASAALDDAREPPAPPRPRLPVVWVQTTPVPGGAATPAPASAPTSSASADGVEKPTTTMVRVSCRGVLLAARGAQSEQLANAAAFIHNQARLLAQDLGRHGRTAVHVRGGEQSLLVVKSEVNDIAAALGPSERLRSLLRKAGLG